MLQLQNYSSAVVKYFISYSVTSSMNLSADHMPEQCQSNLHFVTAGKFTIWDCRYYIRSNSLLKHTFLLLLLLSSSLFPLCRVFIHIFLRQTMSLRNTAFQLFCHYYLWCLYPQFLRWHYCNFTLALSKVCVQCIIWLFSVVPSLHGFLVCCLCIFLIILKWSQSLLLLLVSPLFLPSTCVIFLLSGPYILKSSRLPF